MQGQEELLQGLRLQGRQGGQVLSRLLSRLLDRQGGQGLWFQGLWFQGLQNRLQSLQNRLQSRQVQAVVAAVAVTLLRLQL